MKKEDQFICIIPSSMIISKIVVYFVIQLIKFINTPKKKKNVCFIFIVSVQSCNGTLVSIDSSMFE